jgi:sulfur carrier protein ThiS
MNITLKLYATLRDYLPPDTPGSQLRLDLPEAATIPEALASVAVPPGLAHIVMINGRHVVRPQWGQRILRDGDELAVWPAIGGG